MSKVSPRLGTAEWRDHVFANPSVRRVKGRSKHTQSHDVWSRHMGRRVIVQGRNEAIAALVLEHMCTLRMIRRYKEQPFRASIDEFGHEIIPDFLVESSDGSLCVVEVKTARYLTAHVESVLRRTRAKFDEFGVRYLVWSDREPLTHALRHNIIEMNRLKQSVDEAEISNLEDFLQGRGSATVGELYAEGFDRAVIYAATSSGRAYFRLVDAFTNTLLVSLNPLLDFRAIFLGARGNNGLWWTSLSSYGGGR